MRIALVVAALASCAPHERSMVRVDYKDPGHGTLTIHVAASMPELTRALHEALGRKGGDDDDCALFVNLWDPKNPDEIRIVAPDVDLGGTPVCGPNAGSLIAAIARGVVHFTPAGGGPIYWTDRPLRAIHTDRPKELSQDEAYAKAKAYAAEHPDGVFVLEAPADLNAFDMMRNVRDLAVLKTYVVFYPSGERPKNYNE